MGAASWPKTRRSPGRIEEKNPAKTRTQAARDKRSRRHVNADVVACCCRKPSPKRRAEHPFTSWKTTRARTRRGRRHGRRGVSCKTRDERRRAVSRPSRGGARSRRYRVDDSVHGKPVTTDHAGRRIDPWPRRAEIKSGDRVLRETETCPVRKTHRAKHDVRMCTTCCQRMSRRSEVVTDNT